MSWNYRVVHRVLPSVVPGESPIDEYAVHEAYYDDPDDAPKTISVGAICPCGESIEELKSDIAHYVKALEKPVLEYDSFDAKLPPQ